MTHWLRNLVAASKDQDKFWREWHLKRAEKRLAYWESERRKHLSRAFAAGRMAQHYMDRILDRCKPQHCPTNETKFQEPK